MVGAQLANKLPSVSLMSMTLNVGEGDELGVSEILAAVV